MMKIYTRTGPYMENQHLYVGSWFLSMSRPRDCAKIVRITHGVTRLDGGVRTMPNIEGGTDSVALLAAK